MSKMTYMEAAAAMQAGVALKMSREPADVQPKHLRVGVNSAMSQHAGLAELLIAKGVITEEEYGEAMAQGMRNEVAMYEQELSQMFGAKVTLGYDTTTRTGCVTIDNAPPKAGKEG